MKRITVGVGYTFDRDNKLIPDEVAENAKRLIVEHASRGFGGVTVIDTYGGWKDGNGQIVMEPGWTIQILTDECEAAEAFARYVKGLLNQASVVLIIETKDARFV